MLLGDSRFFARKRSGRSKVLLKQFVSTPNAGDLASAIIVSHVASCDVEVVGEAAAEAPNLIAIGSILHWADENSVIWGTGFIDETVTLAARPKSVLAVRGPLTWERLRQQGVSSPPIFGDPGVFLPQVYAKQPSHDALGLVPHYVDRSDPFVLEAAARGVKIIDVTAPIDQYAAALSSCERVLSSSLHGLVFAHAYGIPAAWIRLSNNVLGEGFKFFDYYLSVGVKKNEVPILTPGRSIEALSQSCHIPACRIDEAALRNALTEGLGLRRFRGLSHFWGR